MESVMDWPLACALACARCRMTPPMLTSSAVVPAATLPVQTMRRVVLPQAFKNILPALGNEFVTVIKESSIVTVIGITELMFNTSQVYSSSYRYFESLIVCALIYFVMTFTTSRLLGVLEGRMKRSAR